MSYINRPSTLEQAQMSICTFTRTHLLNRSLDVGLLQMLDEYMNAFLFGIAVYEDLCPIKRCV